MAIPTTRAKETAEIRIDTDLCTGCGACVEICSDYSLKLENGKAAVSETPAFGCIGCGHCMAVCPEGAIEIHGRTLSPEDLFTLPAADRAATYDALLALYQRRRSIRKFNDRQVEPEVIRKILDAAVTVPMGLPPSDVHVMILDSREKNWDFARDFCAYLEGMQWFVSRWFQLLMRPFWGKAMDEMMNGFLRPLFDIYISGMKEGRNVVTHDAPLVLYFYGTPFSDPADPVVAATAAMYAGESLGLGTCMLGAIHPMIQRGKKAKHFREKYGIKYRSQEGLFVIFGYHDAVWRKGIRRTFAG
jgi:ferredoxin